MNRTADSSVSGLVPGWGMTSTLRSSGVPKLALKTSWGRAVASASQEPRDGRRIGADERTGRGRPIDLVEHLALEIHALGYRFDDDVRLGDAGIQRLGDMKAGERASRGSDGSAPEASRSASSRRTASGAFAPGGERSVEQRRLETPSDGRERNPAPHGAGPDDRDALHRRHGTSCPP